MITELGHYRIFQRPKYATATEIIAFSMTILAIIVLIIVWLS
jgi:hypothetical protein